MERTHDGGLAIQLTTSWSGLLPRVLMFGLLTTRVLGIFNVSLSLSYVDFGVQWKKVCESRQDDIECLLC
jgi:hypothetical protein